MNLKFVVKFYGPFAVSTGKAGRSADSTVDNERPLPETSLKGLMRAAAKQLLIPNSAINEVFGEEGKGSSWNWGPVSFVSQPVRQMRGRVSIDSDTYTAKKRALAFEEQHWSASAAFDIQQLVPLDTRAVEQHAVVLMASAGAVHSIGKNRRRASGWVGIEPVAPWTAEQRVLFDELFAASSALPSSSYGANTNAASVHALAATAASSSSVSMNATTMTAGVQ